MSETPPAVYLNTESLGRESAGEALESSSLVNSFDYLDLKFDQSREFVDTDSKIASLVAKLQDLPTNPPSLYIDIKGINLSRHGSISILQIYILPLDETYLVDIYSLQERAFLAMASHKGRDLLGILESPDIPKVFFDVRNDSDALFSHFNVKLAGVIDLQLMELATSSFPRRYVSGLEKCLEREASLTAREFQIWRASKEKGPKLFDPKRGGSYEVLDTRPLPKDIKEYCVQDVRYLSRLWVQYDQKISPAWAKKVTAETLNRVKQSQAATYDAKGEWKKLAPASWW
ncbi:hypothetical protein N7507_002557 [Penicillium longicatenatum]|nr:hypothetical protein N7507_002557 [Penicillium longicatenatum]